MKKLLWLLLFCIAPLYAEEIAWSNNQAGGKIVLTNEKCYANGRYYDSLYRSFMYSATGLTMNSCYILDGSTIRMVYEDGAEYRYPITGFVVRNSKKDYL